MQNLHFQYFFWYASPDSYGPHEKSVDIKHENVISKVVWFFWKFWLYIYSNYPGRTVDTTQRA